MTVMTASDSKLLDKAETACQRIAPVWPATNFVAVNPYHGLAHQSFWQVHETLERITGTGLCMPRAYYREQVAQGRITRKDLAAALQELGSSWDVSAFEQELARDNPLPPAPFPLLTSVLAELNGQDWPNFVVERISRYCAAYFDEGQALWSMPWRGTSLYTGWTAFTRFDKSPRVMGVRGMRKAMTTWPESAQGAIVWALRELDIPLEAVDDYLHAALLSVGGWAGWTRYLRWQAELQGGHDDSMRDLLAIRLAWDALLYKLSYTETLETQWRRSLASAATPPGHRKSRVLQTGAVLQTAFEAGYQRRLAASLTGAGAAKLPSARAEAQAVFCIDVRSEVYRRALETVAPPVETLGTAGFFGVLMEYLPFGAAETQGHLPIFFKPSYRISEGLNHASAREVGKLAQRRHTRVHVAKAWKMFKTSAASCFGFVEAAGLLSAPKLISDSMGWSRPVPSPERLGLSLGEHNRLSPLLTSGESGAKTSASRELGIPEADRPAVAEFVLRNMGLVRDFAKLVLIVGHRSTTVNNPQATGLDCGACAGQSGEASARIAAALLNDPPTRRGLAEKDIDIPDDTYFLAALHDTATDEVQLFGADAVPVRHSGGVAQLRQWLDAAGDAARMERSRLLGLGGSSGPFVHTKMQQRSRDWAQLRPEWALAGNAAFIAAPRKRTAGRDLAGRAFLHEYDWHHDTGFNTLQLIMTGPMIVAHWINMQYYGSVVDNRRLGSGNKVLHNVVGGSIGVLEGNGGDLRPGLALQSLHDGVRWMHEPMRLMVIIEAPQHAIDNVILGHNAVRDLAGNAWIHLFQLGDNGRMNRRSADGKWRPY